MANRRNPQSPQLRLKDSIKKELSRTNKETLPLHCYEETAKQLRDIIHPSSLSKKNLSIEDVIKFQNDKSFKIKEKDLETFENYINSLTDEQNKIYYFDEYYDLENEEIYEKRLCSDLDKISKTAINYACNLFLSLSWLNDEIEKLNSKNVSEINNNHKAISKFLKQATLYKNIVNKYSPYWNKVIVDLIQLYNEYVNKNPEEGIIHGLVILSSSVKKEDLRHSIDEVISELYKKYVDTFDLGVLKTLFFCSLTVKSFIMHEIGDTREFVMEKIVTDHKLKQMFFAQSDADP